MSRYSSDSDSSSYRHSRRKRRSASSSSSDVSRHKRSKSTKRNSSSRYKKSKRYRSRSYKRSRSRSKTSSRRSRSTSKNRHRRSHSRAKYRSKQGYKSRSQSKGNSSKYHSRSSSSDSKNSSSSSSTSKSSSASSKKNQNNSSENPDEQLREKLLKAIKAAESADHQLKQQGVLPKGVRSRNTITNLTPSQPQSDVLKDINAEEFVPKTFKSSRQTKEENFDDLNIPSAAAVAVGVPEVVDESSIFYVNTFNDPNGKMDRWVKKLFQIRQKAIAGDSSMGCGVSSFLKKTEKTYNLKIT